MQHNTSQTTSSTLAVINAFESVCVPIICSVGILGNALNLLVLSRTRMRQSVSNKQEKLVMCAGLIALAVADLLVCACIFPRSIVPAHEIFFEHWSVSLAYQAYGTALIGTFSMASTLLLVLMAGMRYLAICHPLRTRGLSIDRGFYVALVAIFPLALIINLPMYWIHQVTEGTLKGGFVLFIDIGQFSHLTSKGKLYMWARAVIGLFIPVALLTFFNLYIVRALKASDRLRREHAVNSPNYRSTSANGSCRLTVTLVAVIVAFIVLVFPCELLDVLTHLTNIVRPDASVLMIARSFVALMQVSNFALNVFLYSALNAQFRTTLQKLLCNAQLCNGQSSVDSIASPVSDGHQLLQTKSSRKSTTTSTALTTLL